MKNLLAIIVMLLVLIFINSTFIVEPSALASLPTGMPAQQQFFFSINSIEVIEGDQGTTNAVFTVTVSPAAFFNVRVDYATADNTAIAGSDYTPASGTLTFPGGGNPTATISVPIIGDNLVEPPETFFVLLRNPSPAEYVGIGSGAGTCTIISNDTRPAGLYILNTDVVEGQGGSANASLRVELSPPRIVDVLFDYATENVSAVAGSDYMSRSGTLTIPAGSGNVNISIPIIDDTLPELTQRFLVRLSNARGASIQDDEGVCNIIDNDTPDSITVCSSDTPINSSASGFIDSRLMVDRNIIVNDLEVKLFVTHLGERPDRIEGRLMSPVARGDGELFNGLEVPPSFSIGTTCSPSPNFVITDNAARRVDQAGEAPFVGRWRPKIPLSSPNRTLTDVNASGTWRLVIDSTTISSTARKRLECWCLGITGPREGLKLTPSTAVVPIDQEDAFGLGNPDDYDFAACTFNATVNGSGVPAIVPVTFTIRDQTGRVLQFDGPFGPANIITTDPEGRAEFAYRNWVPGEHTIEARAEVNGAIYTDTARVSWINPCAATASLQATGDATATLNTMRDFRDSKLTKSNRGRQYTRLYYKFSSEAVRLMMFNPMMLLRSQQMIERYTPVLRDMAAGNGAVLTEGDLKEMEDFMNYCAEKGSPELKQAFRSLREDLRNPAVHEELGVTITAGAKRELPGHNRLQSLSRVRSWGMLIGAGLLLYGFTGRRWRFLRKSRKQIVVAIAAISVIGSASPLPKGRRPLRSAEPLPSSSPVKTAPLPAASHNSPAIHPLESVSNPQQLLEGKAEVTSWSYANGFQSSRRDSSTIATPNSRPLTELSAKRSVAFEANHGQTDSPVKFVARGRGYNLLLRPTEADLQLRIAQVGVRSKAFQALPFGIHNPESEVGNPISTMLTMKLIDANPDARITGLDRLATRTNYFIGKDRSQWHADLPSYARVKSEQVYPGIDMLYYGNQREIEYDFIVAPGADPGAIAIAYHGADKIEVDPQGDLLLRASGGELRQRKPVAYQVVNGAKREIACRYNLDIEGGSSHNPESKIQNRKSKVGRVGFEVARYDPTLPLVIDPVLDYSTYLGGGGDDQGTAISLDAEGNIYVAGLTDSIDLPATNATQPGFGGGGQDAFVAKFDPSGARPVYLTYLGGNDVDTTTGMAIDSTGNAYITGFTRSRNFPSLNALQANNRGQFNSFVVKVGPTGNLVYSTYLGGTANDSGSGVAVDSAGNTYVAGIATSANFPTVNALQPNLSGAADVYVAKLNALGNQLLYSTYTGGSQEDAATSVAVDPSGNVYVTGTTLSTDFTTANPAQAAHGGGLFDAFVAKLNPSSNQLVYSTYLGGGNADRGLRIAADSSGNAYVTGDTRSRNFPTANAFQRTVGGSSDAFVVKLNSTGSLAYSSYLGGSGVDGGTAIAVSANGSAFVTGFTDSIDFATSGAVQAAHGGSFDAFVARVNPSGNALEYSTYLGGRGTDSGFGIAAFSFDRAYIVGVTDSTDFPTANPFQPDNHGGASDVFIARIRPGPGINGAAIQGKHLIVSGGGFAEGARILINGETKKTTYLSATSLRGKKVGRMIASGQTVRIQVRNPDGMISNEFSFMRP